MAYATRKTKLEELHTEALLEFDEIYAVSMPERSQCLEDRRFYSIAGAQWEGPLGEQFDNKLRLEVNKIHLAVIRIFNEYRNNRITVNFIPKDFPEDAEDSADVLNGLYRTDEEDSNAEEAYDTAFEEGVGGGMGAWRLRGVYEDEEDAEDDRQRVVIEPIHDADSTVFFDLGSTRQDKSDAQACYVLTPMTRAAFRKEYGHDGADFRWRILRCIFDWVTPDVIYVAEYYRVEKVQTKIHTFTGMAGDTIKVPEDELEEQQDILKATGYKRSATKTVKRQRVRKYILSGTKVEEDCGYIVGEHIPIIPYYGKRWYVDGIERLMGHVRLSKDSQRLKNMQLSKLGEMAAMSPTEKPIFYPEEIAGYEMMWAEDNIKNYPYLLRNKLQDSTGSHIPNQADYTRAPNVPPAMAALLAVTDADIDALLGTPASGEQLTANTGYKAVELVQTRLDMQSFIYVSNMAKALRRSGEVWLSMARELYHEPGRVLRTTDMDGRITPITLKEPTYLVKTGEIKPKNDFGASKFRVTVDVGPSSVSRRTATVRGLTGMMALTQDPETQQVLGATAMMNMEGEGLADLREYFRKKLVAIGAVKPTAADEEAAKAAAQVPVKPDPQAEYLQAAAQEALAKGEKARSDAVLAAAKAELTRAQTVDVAAGLDARQQDRLLELAEALGENGSEKGVANSPSNMENIENSIEPPENENK